MLSIKKLNVGRAIAVSALALVSVGPAFAWGSEGHRLVARVAAAHLTSPAREHVAALLGVDASDLDVLTDAMAKAATWADEVKGKPEGAGTSDWHFLDLAYNDTKSDIAQRCPDGDCITAKLADLSGALRAQKNYHFGSRDYAPADELRFIIHFMGDIHQPLHSATNADKGGNCLHTQGFGATELHAAWDTGLVEALLTADGKSLDEAGLARSLNRRFASKRAAFAAMTDFEDMALESRGVAFESAYGPLLSWLPAPEPRPFLKVTSCTQAAEFDKLDPPVDLTAVYDDGTLDIVRQQLAKAGYRLANLLNTIFKDQGM